MGKKIFFLLKNPMIFKEFREFFYMQLSEFKNSMHFKSYTVCSKKCAFFEHPLKKPPIEKIKDNDTQNCSLEVDF